MDIKRMERSKKDGKQQKIEEGVKMNTSQHDGRKTVKNDKIKLK